MKLTKLATAAMLAAVTAAPAFAGSTTHTLNVSASVTGNCRFNGAGPTALAFGAIDPSGTGAILASTTVPFRCTTGTTSSISTDDGVNETGVGAPRVRLGATASYMPYSLTLSGTAQAGTGHGAGQDKTLTVDGSIAEADYANAPAGAYADTVTLTITP